MKHDYRTRRAAFTLIELLFVIAIIGILAGLLLVVVARSKEQARKTKAKAEVTSIITAWNQYLQDYTVWPDASIDIGDDSATPAPALFAGAVINLLSGKDQNGQNPRKIAYMEFRSGEFLDPWMQPYRFMVDKNMDNEIILPYSWGTVQRQAVAWSMGPDKTANTADDICTWK